MSEEIKQFVYELVGPNARKTCQLGPSRGKKYQFVDGKHAIVGSASSLSNLTRILAKAHNAHMPGSPEHVQAVAAWAANRENPENLTAEGMESGHSQIQPTAATGQRDAVPSNVQPAGSGTSASKTNDVKTDNATNVHSVTAKNPAKS